jgi:DNA polymerase I-like protein with 3'-5' exonuclease and polymerase domains
MHCGFQMLLQVHDAVGFQVPEANADRALSLLPDLMRIPSQSRVEA